MTNQELDAIAQQMVTPGRGLIAMDESHGTIEKRFQPLGVACTEENRRSYRELIVTTPGLGEFVSGAILFDETIRQSLSDGTSFPAALRARGILPGIKVDQKAKGLAGHPGEKVTEGLDGLRERLTEYAGLGARFAKWRAVITIGDGIPSRGCLCANGHALARYAALCQEAGLVPVVEPEVLLDGNHTIDRCFDVSEATLRVLFAELFQQRVRLEGTILKASMVLSGKDAKPRAGVDEVAEKTLRCLRRAVPAAVPGVVFLSGGQTPEEATAHLNAMNQLETAPPWRLSFSYSRALQEPVMAAWAKAPSDRERAQRILHHRARMNGLATRGEYSRDMESSLK